MDGLIAAFLLMAASFALFKRGWLSYDLIPSFRVMVIYLALPAFVFVTFVREDKSTLFNPALFLMITLGSFIVYLSFFLIGRIYHKWSLERVALLAHGSVAGNCLLLGVPIFMLSFGEAINPVVAQIILYENILLLPAFMLMADMAMQGGRGAKAVLKSFMRNQFLWAVVLAMALNIMAISPPQSVMLALDLLGQAAAPVALVTLGGILARTQPGKFLPTAIMISLAKLIVLPLLGFGLGQIMGVSGDTLIIMTLFMALPSAVTFPVFGDQVAFSELSNSVFITCYALGFFTLSAWILVLT